MIKWLKSLFAGSAEKRRNDGYNYAAGHLLASGGYMREHLEQSVDDANAFHDSDQFDVGIQLAIQHWDDISALREI